MAVHNLFGAERLNGIDGCGPAGREVAGQGGRGDQDGGDQASRSPDRSAVTPNSSDDIRRVSPAAAASPIAAPIPASSSPWRTNIRRSPAGLRAQSHADADLASPLRNRIGDDAVNSHDAQHQRHAAGNRQHHQGEGSSRHGLIVEVLEASAPGTPAGWRSDRPDGLAGLGQEALRRRPVGADQQTRRSG